MFKPKGVIFLTLIIIIMALSCSGPESDQPLLTAEFPLHLEEHIEAATIEGSQLQEDLLNPLEWRFERPQPDWKPVKPSPSQWEAVQPVQAEDALRLPLTRANRDPGSPYLVGGIYGTLPDLNIKDWAYVEIRARTQDPMSVMGLDFNYIEGKSRGIFPFSTYRFRTTPLVTDGAIQTYRLPLDMSFMREWEGRPLTELGIWFVSQPDEEAATLDILSVRLLPQAYIFADAPVGVRTVERSEAFRRTLYMHAPGQLKYKVRVPKAGRFDVGLGVLKEDSPVTFKITAFTSDEEGAVFFEETYANQEEWGQRSVDLSSMAGKTVRISLETDAEQSGEVALWAAPTISGMQENDKPNIVFYIIDGARADLMSVYGYNRRTTPFLERLAAEGAIFENAYSNSTWTKVSNPTFMTSLHHSVLGGYQSENNPLPDQAVTMAQHVHRVGYQTGVFTSNAYCGTMSGFDRGVDALREAEAEINSQSSKELQEDFWNWRKAYPGGPYWVHFQTTDIHPPLKPTAPFSGLFISPELRETFYDWELKLEKAHGRSRNLIDYPASAYEKAGINRKALFNAARDLHDETMAHNDYQIGKLVERLKASGEWENTLFIVAADHGGSPLALGLFDKETPYEGKILCSSSRTRIPLIIVWPERIAPGQRFSQPVSMIDMLPTILDFAELPMPEMMQGQSLAPLLLKEGSWEPRPVIFDEFYDYSGTLKGLIEVIDGRWGASLSINILPDDQEAPGNMRHRPSPLLLFDIWNDPHCLHSLHEKRPDLVKKYTKFLEAQWKAHQALAQHFTRSEDSPLTPEQLETLRSLGYIR